MTSIPKSIWQGSFKVFGVDLKCHVLDNGQRIIEADSVKALLEAMSNPSELLMGDLEMFSKWQRGIE